MFRSVFTSVLVAMIGLTWINMIFREFDANQAPESPEVTATALMVPVLSCPANITVSLLPGQCDAVVEYTITAVDTTLDEPVITQIDGSGYTAGDAFPIGVTEQRYMATTSAGAVTCSFTVTVLEFVGSSYMGCNDTVNIGVDLNCEVYLFADMVLEGNHYGCYDDYIITVDGIGTDTGLIVFSASELLGGNYKVTVTDPVTGNYCWGSIVLEDKIAPEIICACSPGEPGADTCQILCLEVALLASGQIPEHLYPEVIENCDYTLEISHIDVDDLGCNEGTVIVTWLVTDQAGATASCAQQFDILPLPIDSVTFPDNYIGECGSSSHPSATGWPMIMGYDLTDQFKLCNLFVLWVDKDLDDCGGGRKILRYWTVHDVCDQQLVEGQQVIKLSDDQGPVLACPPDISVGPDFWACSATVNVPKPQIISDCSGVASYQLAAETGIVLQIGNEFRVAALPLGIHVVTWTVTDICGNTSTCSVTITVIDNVVPVANCDHHSVVGLTTDGPDGITLVPASNFDDGSYDHCGPVTFRARRMTSCIGVDWTTLGGGIDDIPNGIVDEYDMGLVFTPEVPFACCDVPRVGSRASIMVVLEVTDAAGNVNYCMVEIEVQDKIAPVVTGLPDISVSCDFWFHAEEGHFRDYTGNNNGNLDEDPLSDIFGNLYDAVANHDDQSLRQPIIINDPGNPFVTQPHFWGYDGWIEDNCGTNLEVEVRIHHFCPKKETNFDPPPGATKLIERRFTIRDSHVGFPPTVYIQKIWVMDFLPFYISDTNCNNSDPNDGVRWPCDIEITTCPDVLTNTGEPQIFADPCNIIGVTYVDTKFEFTEGACYKILREWTVIDWCQYNSGTGYGLWNYTQVIKVVDHQGPVFIEPCVNQVLCNLDEGVIIPDNNQINIGESNPQSSSCSVHLNLKRKVREMCSDAVWFDVKLYPNNGTEFIVLQSLTEAPVDENNEAIISFDTRNHPLHAIRLNGIPYNSPWCGDSHRILWSVQDGCGNWTYCQYLIRLEDCKPPTPVCIHGLSTVLMPMGCSVTLWAKDFNASSFDDCTPSQNLLYSFSGDVYEPSKTFNATNIPAFGVELSMQIWVADGGTDDNCNGQISWSERNKDFCTTSIVFTDNSGNCGPEGGIVLGGEILTHHGEPVEAVSVSLMSQAGMHYTMRTAENGLFLLAAPESEGQPPFTIQSERLDQPRNGVNTLDLIMIQRHLLGIETFTTPFQYIAADADNSQSVSAIDLVEIRRLILGITNGFNNSPSWRFVDKQYTFADPYHPWPFAEVIQLPNINTTLMGLDLIGIKVGDINNSVKANARQLLPRSGDRKLPLSVEAPEMVTAGEIFSVTLTFPEPVIGFQWTMQTPGLELGWIESDDIDISEEHYAVLQGDITTLSWNTLDFTAPKKDTYTLRLYFTARESGSVADRISLGGDIAQAEAYTFDQETVYPVLETRDVQTGQGFALYQNEPNPWSGSTLIRFELPEAGKARLTLFDLTGSIVLVVEREFSAGENTIEITEGDMPATGILYYRLESGSYAAAKKMLRLK